MTQQRYKEQILAIVSQHLPGCTVYLYGSRARNTHQPGADIDLAIDNGARIADGILATIRYDIEDTTVPLMVDIVDVHAIDKDFYNTISKEWVVWKK